MGGGGLPIPGLAEDVIPDPEDVVAGSFPQATIIEEGLIDTQFGEELEDAAKIAIGTNPQIVQEQLAVEGLGIDKGDIPGQEKFEEEFGLSETFFEVAQATGAAPSDYEIRKMKEEAQAQNVLAEASRRERESYIDWQKRFARGRNRALYERLARQRRRGALRSLLTDGADFTPGTSSGLGPSFSL
jgi:hypothetical protein